MSQMASLSSSTTTKVRTNQEQATVQSLQKSAQHLTQCRQSVGSIDSHKPAIGSPALSRRDVKICPALSHGLYSHFWGCKCQKTAVNLPHIRSPSPRESAGESSSKQRRSIAKNPLETNPSISQKLQSRKSACLDQNSARKVSLDRSPSLQEAPAARAQQTIELCHGKT